MAASLESPRAAGGDALTGRGFLSWLFQRISGLFLAFFLGVHIIGLRFVRDARLDVAGVVERLRDSPEMAAFYLAFVAVVVAHAVNGVWGIALDFGPSRRSRRVLANALRVVGVLAVAYGVFVLWSLLGMG